jgi:hypothetical protein
MSIAEVAREIVEVTCNDGTKSCAGGRQGACSHHGGIKDAARDVVREVAPSVEVVAERAREMARGAGVALPSARNPGARNAWMLFGLIGLAVAADVKTRRDAKRNQQPPE